MAIITLVDLLTKPPPGTSSLLRTSTRASARTRRATTVSPEEKELRLHGTQHVMRRARTTECEEQVSQMPAPTKVYGATQTSLELFDSSQLQNIVARRDIERLQETVSLDDALVLARKIVTSYSELAESVETGCALVVEYVWKDFMEHRTRTPEDKEKITQWRSEIEQEAIGEKVHRFLGIAEETRHRMDKSTKQVETNWEVPPSQLLPGQHKIRERKALLQKLASLSTLTSRDVAIPLLIESIETRRKQKKTSPDPTDMDLKLRDVEDVLKKIKLQKEKRTSVSATASDAQDARPKSLISSSTAHNSITEKSGDEAHTSSTGRIMSQGQVKSNAMYGAIIHDRSSDDVNKCNEQNEGESGSYPDVQDSADALEEKDLTILSPRDSTLHPTLARNLRARNASPLPACPYFSQRPRKRRKVLHKSDQPVADATDRPFDATPEQMRACEPNMLEASSTLMSMSSIILELEDVTPNTAHDRGRQSGFTLKPRPRDPSVEDTLEFPSKLPSVDASPSPLSEPFSTLPGPDLANIREIDHDLTQNRAPDARFIKKPDSKPPLQLDGAVEAQNLSAEDDNMDNGEDARKARALESLRGSRWLTSEAIVSLIKAGCSAEAHVFDSTYVTVQEPDLMFKKSRLHPRKERLWILPLNHNHKHWTLAVVDIHNATVEYYDSLSPNEYHGIQALENLIKSRPTGPEDPVFKPIEDWTFRGMPCPEQQNNFDCGVCVVVFAYHVFLKLPLPPTLDTSLWRKLLRYFLDDHEGHSPCEAEDVDGSSLIGETFNADLIERHSQRLTFNADLIEKGLQCEREKLAAATLSTQQATAALDILVVLSDQSTAFCSQAKSERDSWQRSRDAHRQIVADYPKLEHYEKDALEYLSSALGNNEKQFQRSVTKFNGYDSSSANWKRTKALCEEELARRRALASKLQDMVDGMAREITTICEEWEKDIKRLRDVCGAHFGSNDGSRCMGSNTV